MALDGIEVDDLRVYAKMRCDRLDPRFKTVEALFDRHEPFIEIVFKLLKAVPNKRAKALVLSVRHPPHLPAAPRRPSSRR